MPRIWADLDRLIAELEAEGQRLAEHQRRARELLGAAPAGRRQLERWEWRCQDWLRELEHHLQRLERLAERYEALRMLDSELRSAPVEFACTTCGATVRTTRGGVIEGQPTPCPRCGRPLLVIVERIRQAEAEGAPGS